MARGRKVNPETLRRDNEAINLRAQRMTWQQIADRLGYASDGAVRRQVARRLNERQTEMNASVDTLLQQELAELDLLAVECYRILNAARPEDIDPLNVFREVIRVARQYGDVPEDWPITAWPSLYGNDERVLQAVDRLHKLAERRAKLLGLDTKAINDQGGLTITINGISDAEMP